jgi:uncharacterized protein (DUF58 family)
LHRSPQHGHSQQFKEYRPYSQGDDLRYFDWKRYAKSEREVVKVFEDETQMNVMFMLDSSASMYEHYSTSYSKLDYATTMIASLAMFCEEKNDRYGLLKFSDEIESLLPCKSGLSHLSQCFAQLERRAQSKGSDLLQAFQLILDWQRKPSLIVLVSDLLFEFEPLLQPLQQLLALGHEIVLLQILDQREWDFKFEQSAIFEDVETGKHFHINPDLTRSQYQQSIQEHQAKWQQISDQMGLSLQSFFTNEMMSDKLRECFQYRQHLGSLHRVRS